MTRDYCDSCDNEIPKGQNCVGSRIQLELGRVRIEIMVAVDNTWNNGHVCEDCIKKAVAQGVKPKEYLFRS